MSLPALAQRVADNAVTSAHDAFGSTIGNETIGLYSASDARGFSPVVAGNLRVDGLFFDQLDFTNARLFDRRTVRVGPSAQGYPFPAPSGIVDYHLREVGDTAVTSVEVDGHSYGGGGVEVDTKRPLGGGFGVAAGIALRQDPDYPGGDYVHTGSAGVVLQWRVDPQTDVRAFAGRISNRGDRTTPYIFASGPSLPPVLTRDFLGERWAAWHADIDNAGILAGTRIDGWTVRAGMFRQNVAIERGFDVLYTNVNPSGAGDLVINADPPQRWIYDSGELQAARVFDDGALHHTIYAALRDARRRRSYGGTDTFDAGPASIGAAPDLPEHLFHFGAQNHDSTTKAMAGLAYRGEWDGHGQLSLGVQRHHYRKTLQSPGAAPIVQRAQPTLWNGNLTVQLAPEVQAYGGYTRGLEESDVAPGNAVNRNEAPAAVLTRQKELGVVLHPAEHVSVIAGAFDLQKPYINLDAHALFRELGVVRHRGFEWSMNAEPVPGLHVVAGALLLRARVSGEAVDNGSIGARPVGLPERVLKLNADYALPGAPAWSVDGALSYGSSRAVSSDNRLSEPGHTELDAGTRYRFHLGDAPASLRVLVQNIANTNGWTVARSGGLRPITPRALTATLAVDY